MSAVRAIGHGARRVIDPRQQGSRLAWSDSLFERVDLVPGEPLPPPIPAGEAIDSDFAAFCEAEMWAALRGEGR